MLHRLIFDFVVGSFGVLIDLIGSGLRFFVG